jgi:hypothetical protein
MKRAAADMAGHAKVVSSFPALGADSCEMGGQAAVASSFPLVHGIGCEMGGKADVTSGIIGPTPGTDCFSAPVLLFGVEYRYTMPMGVLSQWFKFPVVAGTQYFVRIVPYSFFVQGAEIMDGTCPALALRFSVFCGAVPACGSDVSPATGFWYIWMQPETFDQDYGLTLGIGPCPP